ncbi:hypothetical protein V6R21_17305 [Limibacter armeniacum]|uniref:alpha/beta hydrolase n=1 Tax=Limibacter armeniacum TaxID=466084 RepID=UPI002FE5E6CE
MQKEIQMTFKAPYYTKGKVSEKTRHIWVVFHGYGQLSRFFMRRFDFLDEETHLVIAPQGLSRFYLDKEYKKVGATWMTREERQTDIDNQFSYLDAVLEAEAANVDWDNVQLHLFGFSQGVATMTRWAVSRQLPFKSLTFWAGKMPDEFVKEQFLFVNPEASVYMVLGDQDHLGSFIDLDAQVEMVTQLLKKPDVIRFEGGHEVKREVLKAIVLNELE